MKSKKAMKTTIKGLALSAFVLLSLNLFAQDDTYQIETVFKGGKASGGFGAITNKFTYINGQFANLVGVYGGWYVNHRFLLGMGGAGLTNDIPVPLEYSARPLQKMSYGYGQFGLMTEYVFDSNRTIHVAFSLFSGPGFTLQYERQGWEDNNFDQEHFVENQDWFFVAEPGVQVEINLLKWMRFSPGVSYRAAFGSNARGLSDSALSDISYNATLKFGKF
jgi:hypothetical protein